MHSFPHIPLSLSLSLSCTCVCSLALSIYFYRYSVLQCALPVITIMALWQLLNLGTGCMVLHIVGEDCIVESSECSNILYSLYIYTSIYLSIYLSPYLSPYLSVCLSTLLHTRLTKTRAYKKAIAFAHQSALYAFIFCQKPSSPKS